MREKLETVDVCVAPGLEGPVGIRHRIFAMLLFFRPLKVTVRGYIPACTLPSYYNIPGSVPEGGGSGLGLYG